MNNLMQLDGVIGAFRFSPKGEVLEHKIDEGSQLNDKVLDLLCHVCVANMAIATMQARGWENMTGMAGFYPIQNFTFIGFDWTAVVSEEFGIVVPNDKLDYEAAQAALNA